MDSIMLLFLYYDLLPMMVLLWTIMVPCYGWFEIIVPCGYSMRSAFVNFWGTWINFAVFLGVFSTLCHLVGLIFKRTSL